MTNIKEASYYSIIDLSIISRDGQKSIRLDHVFSELTLVENVLENTMRGSVRITDSSGILEAFPIHGDEYIHIEFSKERDMRSDDDKIDYTGFIYKISDRGHPEGKQSMQSFILYFASVEQMISRKNKVVQNFSGKISKIAQKVFKNEFEDGRLDILPLTNLSRTTQKTLEVESTLDNSNITFPTLSPIKTMNYLADEAYSESKRGSFNTTFLFFEDRESYKFVSLEKMLDDQRNNELEEFFFRQADIGEDITYNSVRTMRNFNIENTFDILNSALRGHFGSTHVTFDPLTKRHYQSEFSYDDKFDDLTHVDNYRTIENDFFTSGSEMSLVTTGTTNFGASKSSYIDGKDDVFYMKEEEIPQIRNSRFKQLLGSQSVSFTVAGNPKRKLAEVINLWLPSIMKIGEPDRAKFDKFYSGRYLITKIEHVLIPGEYNMNITAVKDGLWGKSNE